MSRRAFLAASLGASALAHLRTDRLLEVAFPGAGGPTGSGTRTVPLPGTVIEAVLPDLVLSAERDDDLVLLDFAFYGFALDPNASPVAIVPTRADNTVVVQFGPQAVGEANYPWQSVGNQFELVVDPPPVLSDLSGPSRLCFRLAYGTNGQSIPLSTMTVADLLDWTGWRLVVPAVAQAGRLVKEKAAPVPSAPGDLETAIEFPYAVFLAPTVYAGGLAESSFSTGFVARTRPLVSPAGVVDLWSASLVGQGHRTADGSAPGYVPQVAAVWAVDYPAPRIVPTPDDTPERVIQYEAPPR